MDKLFIATFLALAGFVGYVVYQGVASYHKQVVRESERTGRWLP
jgi:hypothetical protein